jgi:hypothetical protein
MEGRLGNGQAGVGGLVRGAGLKTGILLVGFAASMAGLLLPSSVSAQVYGEQPARYGNTASFFFYDNRDDQRDFPTNGVFPGNFAADTLTASVGAAGWLGSNPQHQARPYPSQTYYVDVRGRVNCPRHVVEQATAGRPRSIRCLP